MRERPVLNFVESYFRTVFSELSESRDVSENGYPKPIKVSEITSYCELFKIDTIDSRATLLRMVREMDRTYIEVRSEQTTERLKAQSRSQGH